MNLFFVDKHMFFVRQQLFFASQETLVFVNNHLIINKQTLVVLLGNLDWISSLDVRNCGQPPHLLWEVCGEKKK